LSCAASALTYSLAGWTQPKSVSEYPLKLGLLTMCGQAVGAVTSLTSVEVVLLLQMMQELFLESRFSHMVPSNDMF